MRHLPLLSLLAFAAACSSTGTGFGNEPDAKAPTDSGSGGDTGFVPTNDSGSTNFGDASTQDAPSGADASVSTTVYANSDQTLYSLDPQTNALKLIGSFSGTSGTTADGNVTDLAVNANGDLYVNTESVIYKAALPSNPPGTVQLTKIASISLQTGQKFYALAFAPAGSLDTNEVLIGGDGFGELYSIDTGTGATQHLGNFGPDKFKAGYNWALSGDLVFYTDSNNKPTGLATVRPCQTSSCSTSNDYLVGVDMTALATAYKNKTPAATLLGGIYGGSTSSNGPGTTFGRLFGLGAWQGKVFAFERATSTTSPQLVEISTSTGQGSVIPSSVSFTSPDQGWSGAGVTTTVTVTVPPPPPPPL